MHILPFNGDPSGTLPLLKRNNTVFSRFGDHFRNCRLAYALEEQFRWPGTLGDPPGPSIRALLLVGSLTKYHYFKNILLAEPQSRIILFSQISFMSSAVSRKFDKISLFQNHTVGRDTKDYKVDLSVKLQKVPGDPFQVSGTLISRNSEIFILP